MRADYRISCSSSRYHFGMIYAIAMIAVYPVVSFGGVNLLHLFVIYRLFVYPLFILYIMSSGVSCRVYRSFTIYCYEHQKKIFATDYLLTKQKRKETAFTNPSLPFVFCFKRISQSTHIGWVCEKIYGHLYIWTYMLRVALQMNESMCL